VGSGAHKTCHISETVQDRTKVTITDYGLIGSRICAFDWHQIYWPWMTLNGGNAPLAEVNKNSGAHQKYFNEDRPMLSAAKCRPVDLFIRNMRMFAGVHRSERHVGFSHLYLRPDCVIW